jgi:hypothetical protein
LVCQILERKRNIITNRYFILDHFSFSRLFVTKIVDLLRSYKVVLGDTNSQSGLIVSQIRKMSRISFEQSLNQALNQHKDNFDKIVIVYLSNVDGDIVVS